MTPNDITRIRHMSSIAPMTNDNNRAFHHAMLDAGWVPVVVDGTITEWGCYHPATIYSNKNAREYYDEHGRMEPPTPF